MKIGLLFGTFDPPHAAHVAIAEHMRRTQGLDQVWLVVTPLNPFKQDRHISTEQHRLAMTSLAVHDHPGVESCGFELDLPKPNYTVDTLRFMRQRWPEHRFSLIMGSDNLEGFQRWKDPEEILDHHDVLVYPRPGAEMHVAVSAFKDHPRVHLVTDAPIMELSSTRVREEFASGRYPVGAVAPEVIQYIREQALYRD